MFTVTTLIILAGAVSLWLLGLRKRKNMHNPLQKQPPSPPGLPIIGNLHQLGALPHQSLARLAEKHGPVMLLRLGFEPTLVLSSAEAAKEALKTHDVEYSSRPVSFCAGKLSYNYVDIGFTPYSEYWREMRKICVVELFSLKMVQSFQPVRTKVIDSFIESIAVSAAEGEVVDLGERSFELNASITFKIAFGKSFKGSLLDGKGFEKLLHETMAVLGTFSATDFFPYVGWMVDKLSGLHSRLDGNIFLGGVDTGAITLVWALAELVKNPEVMKKVQDEIRHQNSGKDRVTDKDVCNLKYFKMVIKETLRLHPVAPLLVPKKVTAETQMLGYPIHEGVRVYINAWAIARDPKLWNQPEKFIPERFNDSLIDYKGHHFEFLPFGGGRRICPGINMATATIELVLANMLHKFDWKLPDGMALEELDMEEGAGITTFKKVPLKLMPINNYKS